MSARTRRLVVITALCGTAAIASVSASRGQSAAATRKPTFSKDVAPIFQEKCQVCHQPNSIAPMPLLNYADAKKFASAIKSKVEARVMPPWHIDRNIGVRAFKNDRGLTDAEVGTIVSWVEGGAVEGDRADLPAPKSFPDPTGWELAGQFGPPDLVIKSPPYTLAAQTQDKWFRPVSETGLTEERWVRAIEIKPSYRTAGGRSTTYSPRWSRASRG